MRGAVIAVAAVFGLIALPAQAAPAVPDRAATAAMAPDIHFTRGGCGAGWHPAARRDRWGNWHRRCVPNRW